MTDREDDDWAVNANDALHLSLHGDTKTPQVFHPSFTYPIFGDEETIFGYKDLQINLAFAADTLKPQLDIEWEEKYAPRGDTKADDIEELLSPFLPASLNDNNGHETTTTSTFTPPGNCVRRYNIDGKTFGVWSAGLSDPQAKSILSNMQIFIPFFIEGGVQIELDDPEWTVSRWRLFLLYEIISPDSTHPSYSLVGYSTAYRLSYVHKSNTETSLDQNAPLPADDDDLPSHLLSRERISQFLILPPYQSSGHGSHLYIAMVENFMTDTSITEITVEDPSEAFDDMRDVNDLIRLRSEMPSFRDIQLDTSVKLPGSRHSPVPVDSLLDPTTLTNLRTSSKICPRQFSRLIEMQLLHGIPAANRSVARMTRKDKAKDAHDRAYYFWRLLVKRRLYRHNADSLSQLDVEERIEKLDETLGSVERDYLRLLEMADRRAKRMAEASFLGVETSTARAKKRRVVVEEDEDEDEDGDGVSSVAASEKGKGTKRARFAG